jgi:flagellar motor switch protein FliG
MKEEVLEEFYEICLAQEYISEGGIGYARTVLEKALGSTRAEELIERLSSSLQVRPFDFIRKADSTHILNLVDNESPQTIALLLSYAEPKTGVRSDHSAAAGNPGGGHTQNREYGERQAGVYTGSGKDS